MDQIPTALRPHVKQMIELAGSEETFVIIALTAAVALIVVISVVALSSKGKQKAPVFLSNERVPVPLIDKVSLSHDTRRFRFGLPTKDHVLGLPVGQHFTLYAPNVQGVVKGEWNGRPDLEAEETEIERKYTPTTGDHEKGYFDLVIKVYKKGEKPQFPDGGKMSQYLDSLEVGKDTIDIKGPVGRVNYKGFGQFLIGRKELPKKKNIGMMAGGTGITPMLQMIAAVLRNPADNSKLSLLYANQTEDDILVRQELEELAKENPDRFKVWYTVDRPAEHWKYSSGFITTEMIQEHLPSPGPDTIMLMCGPPPMVRFACQANLDKLGYAKEDQVAF
eukprot:CAMPEP_0118936090 /NCGR_PEP_ID=MMETSP1169-20130426/16006_1 /TAXON_ID=36882 /ORGANISM="Pyramimonas obovata, Strain CCMP722" /LENGTH=333 /DNA_ID=CAMNT_0006879201 /DNA_START=115 /DNA_END=1116 /DNA_ORIENTATION=-